MTSLMKRIIPLLLMILLLVACTNAGEKLKNEVRQSLTKQQQLQSYSFSGEISSNNAIFFNFGDNGLASILSSILNFEQLRWEGKAKSNPLELDGKIIAINGETEQTIPLLIKDNQLYFSIPTIDPTQYFYIELPANWLENSADSGIHHGLTTLFNQLEHTAFTEINNEDGHTITAELHPEHLSSVKDIQSSLKPFERFVRMPEADKLNVLKATFTLTQSGYIAKEQFAWETASDQVSITQSYGDWNEAEFEVNPPQAIALNELLEEAARLQADALVHEYEEFEQKVELNAAYDAGTDAAKIAELIESHLSALIDGDREAFMGMFRSTGYAAQHEDFFDLERKYQFTGIEDLQFKRTAQSRTISVRVLCHYIDPDKKQAALSGLIYTLYKNNDNEWTVQSVR